MTERIFLEKAVNKIMEGRGQEAGLREEILRRRLPISLGLRRQMIGI